MRKVVVVQPYVPKYRLSFFDGLADSLSDHGLALYVAAGRPRDSQAMRGDGVDDAPWLLRYENPQLRLGPYRIGVGSSHRLWADADAVVLGLMGSSVETNLALMRPRARRIPIGLWGHVKPYVAAPHPVDLAIERFQIRRADHVFAYTPGGASYAVAAGADPARVTTVMNTIDTSALQLAREKVTEASVRVFERDHSLSRETTFAFIGGLDASKRIGFLCEALDFLWLKRQDIKVLIAGTGADAPLLRKHAERGQVVMLGQADDRLKALIAASSRALLMPGRIGLVAVDALVLGLPVISTDWPYHAPEAEYLNSGKTVFYVRDSPEAYAREMADHCGQDDARRSKIPDYPNMNTMVSNFTSGILKMMS